MAEELSNVGFVPMPRSNKPPVWTTDADEHVYCDGVEVYKWQLTDEECKQHCPRYYETNRRSGKSECPYCGKILLLDDKRGIMAHVGAAHQEVYAAEREVLMKMTCQEAWDYLTEKATRPK